MNGGMHHTTLEPANYVQSVTNRQADAKMIAYTLMTALVHFVRNVGIIPMNTKTIYNQSVQWIRYAYH